MTQHYGFSMGDALRLPMNTALDFLRLMKNAKAEREANKRGKNDQYPH